MHLGLTSLLDIQHMALEAVSFRLNITQNELTPSSSAVMNAARVFTKAQYPLSSANPNLQMLSCKA